MVEINPFSAIKSISNGSDASRKGIADNFDTFLKLLTTQLQNQNPLDPLDTNQFTQQLVQFTEVEQAVRANQNLENLARLSVSNAITSAVSYIGKEVTIDGATSTLQNSKAAWDYQAGGDSQGATFTIKDAQGSTVFTQTRSLSSGEGRFEWNGEKSSGGTAADGAYTLSIDTTTNGGSAVSVSISNKGFVNGVDMSGSEPVFLIGDRKVGFEQILSIRQPVSTS